MRTKKRIELHKYGMKSFSRFLFDRYSIVPIAEVSELFPKDQINNLLRQEAETLLAHSPSEEASESLERFKTMDHVGYIDRSLRRAGFPDHDLDEVVSHIAVKLLYGLFKNWRGQPMDARFKVAVKNTIRTLVLKQKQRRERYSDLPEDVPGRSSPSVSDDLLERFREYIKKQLGDAALRVLDHRLAGGDTKELVGMLGLETSYRTKLLVGRIKEAARRFAREDPELASMIEQAFKEESETLSRRFKKVAV